MRALAGGLLVLGLASAASAQTVVVDEGSFTLSVNGNRTGREQFSIRRNTAGGVSTLYATAVVTMTSEDRRLDSRLITDSGGQPREFELIEKVAGVVTTRVLASAAGGRFSERVFNASGQANKEMRLGAGTLVADRELVHTYYFFFTPERAETGIRLVTPRTLGRDSLTVTVVSAATEVEVGNGNIPARHLMVTDAGRTVTDVWLDDRGRVLRLAVKARGFVATRDEPPTDATARFPH